MRKKLWLAMLLLVMIPFLFTVSCAKKDMQSQQDTEVQPEMAQEEETAVEEVEPEVMEKEEYEASAPQDFGAEFVNENVHFEFDSFALSDVALSILNNKVEFLRTNSDATVTVEGHCDERGTDAYNMALGQKRADTVRDYLINMGIDSNRLNTMSYGEERPISIGRNETAWARNRRAQFVLE